MKRVLRIESTFSNFMHDLDENDNIIIRHENEESETLSINEMIIRFYNNPSVKCFGIDRAFIWNIDEQKTERNITDLPDSEYKKNMRSYKLKNLYEQVDKLQEQIWKL